MLRLTLKVMLEMSSFIIPKRCPIMRHTLYYLPSATAISICSTAPSIGTEIDTPSGRLGPVAT